MAKSEESQAGFSRPFRAILRRPLRVVEGRRRLLKWIGAGAVALGAGGLGLKRLLGDGDAPQGGWRPFRAQGVVVVVKHKAALRSDGSADPQAVAQMVNAGVCRLTGEREPRQAWRRFVRPEDFVALKVNCLAAPELRSHPEIARAATDGLAGVVSRRENLLIYDRLTEELRQGGFAVNHDGPGVRCYGSDAAGYDPEVSESGAVGTCLSRIVSTHATAIINLPVLKDHDLAGISVALKNHFGSINNPNKMHTDHCTPYVADLNLMPALREKQRLIVCDALLVTYQGGPALNPPYTAHHGAVLVGTDPVAVDAVGLGIIEGLRKQRGLEPLASLPRAPRYIALAGRYGLGVADPARIKTITVDLS